MPATTQPAAIDSDVDLHVPAQRGELRRGPGPVLAAVAGGGVLGATARQGLSLAFPHPPSGFAWATFAINVTGCALIGVLMVLVEHLWSGRRLLRPFLGVGVLGGFTTFSSYVLDANQAVAAGAPRTALAYLAATPIAALLGVWVTATLTQTLIERHRPRRHDAAHDGRQR